MRPLRALGPTFRIVIAVLFGFMSLAHGPVMAFAQGQAPPQAHHQPVAHHSVQHDQHAGHHGMQTADQSLHQRTAPSVCYANGCFVAVAPILAVAPVNIPSPLQRLGPAAAHEIVSAELDPSDPPPRLQA